MSEENNALRAQLALQTIEWFLEDIQKELDSMKQENQGEGKNDYTTGVINGYEQAIQMITDRAIILGAFPDPDEKEVGKDDEE